jgi:hypothetical protein
VNPAAIPPRAKADRSSRRLLHQRFGRLQLVQATGEIIRHLIRWL